MRDCITRCGAGALSWCSSAPRWTPRLLRRWPTGSPPTTPCSPPTRGASTAAPSPTPTGTRPRRCAPTTSPGSSPTSAPARPRSSAPAAAPSARWPWYRPTPSWSTPSSPTSPRWTSCSTIASSSARRPRTSSPPTSPATLWGPGGSSWSRPTSPCPRACSRRCSGANVIRRRPRTRTSGSRTSCARRLAGSPDLTSLRAATTRIVVGIGDESDGQLCDRTSTALAAALGIEPTMFPGGHIGFVEDPDRFANRLHAVLHGN